MLDDGKQRTEKYAEASFERQERIKLIERLQISSNKGKHWLNIGRQ